MTYRPKGHSPQRKQCLLKAEITTVRVSADWGRRSSTPGFGTNISNRGSINFRLHHLAECRSLASFNIPKESASPKSTGAPRSIYASNSLLGNSRELYVAHQAINRSSVCSVRTFRLHSIRGIDTSGSACRREPRAGVVRDSRIDKSFAGTVCAFRPRFISPSQLIERG